MLFILIAGAGLVLLQIFLSKCESKWPGLVLPVITFCVSLIYVFSIAYRDDWSALIMTSAVTFLLCNIPTVILLAIYTACRGTRKRPRDLDPTSVQGVE